MGSISAGPGAGGSLAIRSLPRTTWKRRYRISPATIWASIGSRVSRCLRCSVALEAVEGFLAGIALPLSLARRRTEAADLDGVGRAALRAFGRRVRVRR